MYRGDIQCALHFGVRSEERRPTVTVHYPGRNQRLYPRLDRERRTGFVKLAVGGRLAVGDWHSETGSGWETGLGGRTGARRVTRSKSGWTTVNKHMSMNSHLGTPNPMYQSIQQ